MKTIHNIFTKEKIEKPKKEILPPKIQADYRERNCLVASELIDMGFEIEFKELKVADYIVKDTAIERKTVQDFISSMINRRLIRQLQEIQQYENRLLIIEGIDEQELYSDDKEGFARAINNASEASVKGGLWVDGECKTQTKKQTNKINPNAIRGFLLSIALKFKVPIIFTKNQQDTAKFISVLAKKQSNKNFPLNITKKTHNPKEQKQFLIESFPGIGPTTSKKLLENFKSIKNIINAKEQELQKILGKKTQSIKKIIEEEY